jgi:glucose/arabinose dehydrogenase
MQARKFNYPIIILVAVIVLLVVVGVIAALYTHRTKDTQTSVTVPDTPTVTTQQVASGFTQPTGIVSAPNDERLYIVEQTGMIRRVTPNQSDTQVFMDITNKVTNDGEMGLLGLAFHPQYAQNGYIFVNYIDKSQNTVVARYHTDQNVVDLASEKVILQVEQPYTNHNGGDLVFGPDGFLYIALGDGGQAGDPHDNAQNLNSLLGKILRIDVNTNEAYAIPDDNPFAGQENARPEIWAYGLRNPWRISFDRETGDLYIADVGQGELEEINFQSAGSKGGENYGWRCYEGTREYNLDGCEGVNNAIPPIIEYSHEDGRCAVTGGYVYRGSMFESLQGKYFYGDFCGSQLYYAEQKDGSWQQTLALQTEFAISAFGQANDGELYLADYDSGDIHEIKAN